MPEPLMPAEVVTWMHSRDWGMHHVYWHATRQWDLLSQAEQQQLTAAEQTRADHQEGEAGNGWEFLVMHRAMIRLLRQQFSNYSQLFAGWPTPPTDPNSGSDPVPDNGEPKTFDPNKIQAINTLQTSVGRFASDDECGLFTETALRPTPGNPSHRSSDKQTGIHNYLHNRFTDSASPVDMGNPQVNIENQRFWRLHGWIDNRWSAFRTAKNLSETESTYVAALAAAEEHMSGHHMAQMKTMRKKAPTPDVLHNLALAVKRIRREKGF
jgi:hypothetical protein